jgi:seryl-tRNA synthetase
MKVDLDEILELDEKYKKDLKEVEDLRAERNDLNDKIKGVDDSERDKIIEESKTVSEKIKKIEPELENNNDKLKELLYQIPNLISEDTPIGKSEEENKVLRKIGEVPKFDFKPKDHMELGEMHNIIDTEKSAQISGSRFNYLFGEAVLLQFALIQFGLSVLTDKKIIKELANKVGNPYDKPFVPAIVPNMVKSEVMKKMDRFDPIEDRYYLEKDNSVLIGSSEHTLGPLHMDEMIKEEDLPIRYVGYSTAYRREAGAYGKDTKGIIRRHQFDKLEMETFVRSENGLKEQELLVAIQEYLLQKLEIPYQVVLKCTGDMGGKVDFRAIDIECYMPGEGKYRETHTSDYMTDYQARRLKTKYKDGEGNKKFVHMNDATCFAIGRTLITILENYQKEDGSIEIPKVLQRYMGGLKIIKK